MRTVKIIKTFLIAAALPIFASAAVNRYIVELSTEPAARFAARNFGERKESLARPEVKKHLAAIRAGQDSAATEILKFGGRILERTDTTSNTLIVEIADENAAKLSSVPGFKSYHKARRLKANLDQAMVVHNLPLVYSQLGGNFNAGAGIKIGMIDTGIDITQPPFSDSGFQAPAGFPLVNNTADTKYTNNKVIVARSYVNLINPSDPDQGASDESGHGTLTADCAAGGPTGYSIGGGDNGGSLGPYSFAGVAPGAYLGAYKVFGTTGVSDSYSNEQAILKAIDDAVKDGMDVINMSSGYTLPIAISGDYIAMALNNAFAAGVIVTQSAGNDGNDYYYNSTNPLAATIPTFTNSEGAMNVIQVGASSNKRAFGQMLTVGAKSFLVDSEDAVSTNAAGNTLVFTNTPIVDVATVDPTGQACGTLPQNSLTNQIVLISLDGWDANDNCNPFDKMTAAQGAGAAAVIIYDTFPEDLDIFATYYNNGYSYFSDSGIPAAFITRADGLALKSLLASQPGAMASLDFNNSFVPLSSDRLAAVS